MAIISDLSDSLGIDVGRGRRVAGERIGLRVPTTVGRVIEAAAEASGQEVADFVTTAAYERAVTVLEGRIATRLAAAAPQADPPPPPPELMPAGGQGIVIPFPLRGVRLSPRRTYPA